MYNETNIREDLVEIYRWTAKKITKRFQIKKSMDGYEMGLLVGMQQTASIILRKMIGDEKMFDLVYDDCSEIDYGE